MRFSSLALLAALQALALGCAAVHQDPTAPVREAYRLERLSLDAYASTAEAPARRVLIERNQPPWFPVHRPKLFTLRLTGLLEAEDRLAVSVQGVANIDSDLFLDAQDFPPDALHDLAIDVVEQGRDRAVVRARFTLFGAEARALRFEVRLESGRWLIDDVRVSDGSSLAARLGRPL